MKLNIKNFAKIKEAEIEILGITVIAGENNTGKSTIGKIMYCLFECFYDIENKLQDERKCTLQNFLLSRMLLFYDSERDDEFWNEIISIPEEIYSDKKQLENYSKNSRLFSDLHRTKDVEDVVDFVYDFLNVDIEKVRANLINKYFDMEFGYQPIPLIHSSDNSEIVLDLKGEKISLQYDNGFVVKEYVNIYQELVYIENPDIIDDVELSRRYREKREFRNIKNHNHNLLTKLRNGKIEKNIFEETMIQQNFNLILQKINPLLNGEFVETQKYLGFQEKGVTEPLHLANLSTGLKSFIIVKKLIEDGYIKNNGVIVLDEPEVHLHPKWQLIYAEILVILQKELNLHIILTTHSPYFINAIEVYSAKYEIANRCKYYLSNLIDDRAVFEDVTVNIDKIYTKLATPLQELEEAAYE